MRTLVFEPTSRIYERLYWGLLMSPINLTKEELPVISGLLPKLRQLGQLKAVVDTSGNTRAHLADEAKFYVTVAGGELAIEEQEYQFVMKHLEAATGVIHKALSEDHNATIEYLKTVEKWEAKPADAPAAVPA